MLITQAGRRYRLLFESPGRRNDGSCDPPDSFHKAIRIRPSLRRYPARLTETIIHECLHAQGWHIDEEFVARAADEIARVLDRLHLIVEELPR
jgi:hypothetical protein